MSLYGEKYSPLVSKPTEKQKIVKRISAAFYILEIRYSSKIPAATFHT